jgi:protein subunit release factor B
MEVKEIRQKIIDNIKREVVTPNTKPGGQSVGLPPQKVKLYSEECNIAIEVGYYRSQIKNHELAMELMKLTIEELVK